MSTTRWKVFSVKCGCVSLHDTKEEAERVAGKLSCTPFYPHEILKVLSPAKKREERYRDSAPLRDAA